jgi:replicative DNA helicase
MITSQSDREDSGLMPASLYSAEAEKAVLGCMAMQPNEVIDEAIVLERDDFFVPAHQEIFAVLCQMHAAQQAIDAMTLHQWLTDRKLAEAVGSPGILAELMRSYATHLNVGSYIQIVKDKAMLRSLELACTKIVRNIHDAPDAVSTVMDLAESEIFRVTNLKESTPIHDARACVARFDVERAKIQSGEHSNRVLTGLQGIDESNGGFPAPSFVVIAGGPGIGKTAIMLNLLENWCSSGRGVGAFSLEMTIPQLMKRAIASTAGMDSRRLNGRLHEPEIARVDAARAQLLSWQFFIDETSNLTPADLRSKSRHMVKRGASVLELDYLQLMRGTNRRDERREQVAEITRTIKLLANELGILFIVLAQVNREGRKRGELQLQDLAESSTIEQDADAVLLLERKAGSENCTARAIPVIGRWAKYRDGSTGDFNLTYNAPELRFT